MGFWTTLLLTTGKKVTKRMARKAVHKGKRTIKKTSNNLNFMKAPNDSPSELFKGVSKSLLSKPQKVELTDDVKKYLKDTFKIK